LGASHSSARIIQATMLEITETKLKQMFALTVTNQAMTRRVASNSRRRKLKTAMPVILMVTLTSETKSHKMWFSQQL
jgi:hypothetical protein